jgi:hypothetical protein
MEKSTNSKPVLSRYIFWDTDLHKLDFDRYADFTIIRVLERGAEQDIQEVIRYYGTDKIIATVTGIDTLLPRALAISKQLFHLSNDRFQCLKHSPRASHYSKY